MKPLYETYRPATWRDVIGQEKVCNRLESLSKQRGLGGRAFFITGSSGTGKTTIARLIAGEVADKFNIQEMDASKATPAFLDTIERQTSMYAFGEKTGWAYIFNEAHGLRKDSIRQLLVMLEDFPAHAVMIFTTTNEGQGDFLEDHIDANPLLSRCIRIDLARRDLAKPFAEKAKEIAIAEGLDGCDISVYVRLVKENRNNMRAVLNIIESGDMLKVKDYEREAASIG